MIPTMNKQDAFKTIAQQVEQGDLAFPTDVQVALKIRQILDDPDCHLDVAVKLIQAEPLLAARVVAIANSLVYNPSGREIADVRVAVTRLGFSTVRSLGMALVTRQMAGKSTDPKHRELANLLWQHTAHVASLAYVIARDVTHQNPEIALFAGIIHEIGGFYMLSCTDKFHDLLEGDFTDWVESGEFEVGSAVLKKLALPESVIAVIEEYWDGFLAMPPVTLADTLLLAEELCPIPSPLHYLEGSRSAEGTMASIEMVIGEETLSCILSEAAEEVNSLIKALQF